MDKKDKLLKRMYECCLNASGAYRILSSMQKELPGFNICAQRLKDTIVAYEEFLRERKDK